MSLERSSSLRANMARTAQKIKGTTQEFIEITEIVGDFILLKDGTVSLIIETTAVNFALLSSEEQEATIAGFSALLNSLSFPIQIVIRSSKLDLSVYLYLLDERINRQENQLLKTQTEKYRSFVESLMKESTIIDKRFYIVVSFSTLELGPTLKKASKNEIMGGAKASLYPKKDQIVSLLQRVGLKGTVLRQKALIALLYNLFNAHVPLSHELLESLTTASPIEEFRKGPTSMPDLIAPPYVEVDFTSIKVGETFYRTLFVVGYPRFVSPNWLSPLISFDHPLNISMFCYPIEAGDVLSDLRRKIAEMEATMDAQLKEGKEVDPQVKASLEDAFILQEELVKGTERFFQFGLYITIPASSLEELEAVTKKVRATLSSLLIIAKPATLQMEDGFKTTLPLGVDRLITTRNMDTTSLATTFPFTSGELTGSDGILYGVNQQNGSLIVFDRFSLENANSLVLGKSGGGKSFLVKLEALRSLMFGTQILIIDPESEYKTLAAAVGGEFISFKTGEAKYINPFDLAPVLEKGENVLSEKILSLHALMKVILGTVTPTDEAILDRALIETYRRKGISDNPETQKGEPPLLGDLYNVLTSMTEAEAKSLSVRLERFVKGSLSSLFNVYSTVDIKNPFTVFSLRDIEEALRPIAMHIILDFIWTRIRKEVRRRILIVDEAWYLMRYKDSASFLYDIAKRARKYLLGLTTITQDVEDFLNSEYGKAVVTNSSIQILLKQSPASIDTIGKTFNLSQGERYLLLNVGIGQGLFFAGTNHVAIQVVAAAHEKELVSSQSNPQPKTP